MYLFTVNRYVKRDLKVIFVISVGAKQEQGSIRARISYTEACFPTPQRVVQIRKSDSGSTREETTADCLDSCNNLIEIGLDG